MSAIILFLDDTKILNKKYGIYNTDYQYYVSINNKLFTNIEIYHMKKADITYL